MSEGLSLLLHFAAGWIVMTSLLTLTWTVARKMRRGDEDR